MTAPTLADIVRSAIADLLADRTEIAVDAILPALPNHVQIARPSMKLIRATIVAEGWRGMKLRDGTSVYRAPQVKSDPLAASDGVGGNSGAEQLRLLIERLERIREEKKGMADDEKDVFAEAKSVGYETKIIRMILRLRAMEKHTREEEEALLDLYKTALGLA